MYVNSEMIQHLKSQRRSMRRRVGGEKVHDELGQKIVLGHLASPFFSALEDGQCTCKRKGMRSVGSGGSRAIVMLFPNSATFYVPRSNRSEFLPSFWSVAHNGPWCLEGPPERRPWMMKMVPTTMPTRPTVNTRPQTTVSVSSDIEAGISGSVKVKLWNSEYRMFRCMWVGWGEEGLAPQT